MENNNEELKNANVLNAEEATESTDLQKEEKSSKTIRLSASVCKRIAEYRAAHPECRSDPEAADKLFLPVLEKEAATGNDDKAIQFVDNFMTHWEAGRDACLSVVSAYRTLKEDEENKHGGIRDELVKEIHETRDALAKKEKEYDKAAARIVEQEEQIENLQKELADAKADGKQKSDVIVDLMNREDPAQLRKELDLVNEELTKARVSFTEAAKDRDSYRKEVDRLTPENESLVKEKASLIEKNKDLVAQYNNIKESLLESQGNLKEAKKETENAVKQADSKEKELEKEQNKSAMQLETISVLRQENTTLKEQLAAAKEQINTARVEGREDGRKEEAERRTKEEAEKKAKNNKRED